MLYASGSYRGPNFTDSLGSGVFGLNYGVVAAGNANPDWLGINIFHTFINAITNVAFYISSYQGSYAGDYSASGDYTKVLQHGAAGFGLQIAGADLSPISVFSGQGDGFETRIILPSNMMIYDIGGGTQEPSAPVDGSIGADNDTTLGDNALVLTRYILPDTETQGGRRQIDLVYSYNYTT